MFQDVLKAVADRINIDEPHPSWHPERRAWLQLKVSCAIEEDVLVYLKRCISYLAQGPGTGMLLWHLAALDTANACKRLDGSQARLFQSAVLADLRQVKSAPRHIRVLVDRMLARLAQAGPTEINAR